MRPSKRKALDKNTPMGEIMDKLEQTKARIRAKVEHPFRVIKQQFGHAKVRYPGHGQEHGAADHSVWAEQSVDSAQTTFEHVAGMSSPAPRAMACGVGENGRRRSKSVFKNYPDATSMSSSAIHWLSSRSGRGYSDGMDVSTYTAVDGVGP